MCISVWIVLEGVILSTQKDLQAAIDQYLIVRTQPNYEKGFFFLFYFHFYLCVCFCIRVYVYTTCVLVSTKAREGITCIGSGPVVGCDLPEWMLRAKPTSSEEHQVLLTIELCLQLWTGILKVSTSRPVDSGVALQLTSLPHRSHSLMRRVWVSRYDAILTTSPQF